MLLQGVVARLVREGLSTYFEEINNEEIKVGVWDGSGVELSQLSLRTDALDALGLPLVLQSGTIGSFSLTWKGASSLSICIRNCKVYLTEPKNETSYSKQEQEKRLHSRKMYQIQQLLGTKDAKSTSDSSWGVSLLAPLIANIEVTFEQVEIYYTDSLSGSDGGFTLGLHVDKIVVQSTNEKWQENKATESVLRYKILRIENLRLEWVWKHSISENLLVVEPTNAMVKVTMNTSQQNFESPQVKIEVIVLKLVASLSLSQMACIIAACQRLASSHQSIQQIDAINMSYGKEWSVVENFPTNGTRWKQAIQKVIMSIRLNRHWRSWKTTARLLLAQKEYIDRLKGTKQDDGNECPRKTQLEIELPFEALISAHKAVRDDSGKGSDAGWGTWLYSFYDEKQEEPSEQESALINNIMRAENDFRAWKPPPQYVVVDFSAELGGAWLTIKGQNYMGNGITGPEVTLLKAEWKGLIKFEQRSDSWKFQLSVKDIRATQHLNESSNVLLIPSDVDNKDSQVCNISIESNPLEEVESRLHVVVKVSHVDFFLDVQWVEHLLIYFLGAKAKAGGFGTIEHLSPFASDLFKDMILEDYSLLAIKVEVKIHSPVVLVALSPKEKLVIDFGCFMVASNGGANIDNEDRFSNFEVSLENMEASLVSLGDLNAECWRKARENQNFYDIIEPFSWTVCIKEALPNVKKRRTNDLLAQTAFPLFGENMEDKDCPEWMIQLELPVISVNMSTRVVILVSKLVSQVQEAGQNINTVAVDLDLETKNFSMGHDAADSGIDQFSSALTTESVYFDCDNGAASSYGTMAESLAALSTSIMMGKSRPSTTPAVSKTEKQVAIFYSIQSEGLKLKLEGDINEEEAKPLNFMVELGCFSTSFLTSVRECVLDLSVVSVSIRSEGGTEGEDSIILSASAKEGSLHFLKLRYYCLYAPPNTPSEISENHDANVLIGKIALKWNPPIFHQLTKHLRLLQEEIQALRFVESSLLQVEPYEEEVVEFKRNVAYSACLHLCKVEVELLDDQFVSKKLAVFELSGFLIDYKSYDSILSADCGRLNSLVPGILDEKEQHEVFEFWNDYSQDEELQIFLGRLKSISMFDLATSETPETSHFYRILCSCESENAVDFTCHKGIVGNLGSRQMVATINTGSFEAVLWLPFLVELNHYIRRGMLRAAVEATTDYVSKKVVCPQNDESDSEESAPNSVEKKLAYMAQSARDGWIFFHLKARSPKLIIPLSSEDSASFELTAESIYIFNGFQGLHREWQCHPNAVTQNLQDEGNQFSRNSLSTPFTLLQVEFKDIALSASGEEESGSFMITSGGQLYISNIFPLAFLMKSVEFASVFLGSAVEDCEDIPHSQTIMRLTNSRFNLTQQIYFMARRFLEHNVQVSQSLSDPKSQLEVANVLYSHQTVFLIDRITLQCVNALLFDAKDLRVATRASYKNEDASKWEKGVSLSCRSYALSENTIGFENRQFTSILTSIGSDEDLLGNTENDTELLIKPASPPFFSVDYTQDEKNKHSIESQIENPCLYVPSEVVIRNFAEWFQAEDMFLSNAAEVEEQSEVDSVELIQSRDITWPTSTWDVSVHMKDIEVRLVECASVAVSHGLALRTGVNIEYLEQLKSVEHSNENHFQRSGNLEIQHAQCFIVHFDDNSTAKATSEMNQESQDRILYPTDATMQWNLEWICEPDAQHGSEYGVSNVKRSQALMIDFMLPVDVQISTRDILMVSRIISSYQRYWKSNESISTIEDEANDMAGSTATDFAGNLDIEPTVVGPKTVKASGNETQPQFVETMVTFNTGSMGIQVAPLKDSEAVLVRGFRQLATGDLGWAERSGKVQIGDMITSVNGKSLDGLLYGQALKKIQKASRPMTLVFRRRRDNNVASNLLTTGRGERMRTDVIHENQRFFGFLGWSSRLLPTDRASWTDKEGGGYTSLKDVECPTDDPNYSWRWKSQWKLLIDDTTDINGWQYAFNFPFFEDKKHASKRIKGPQDFVRRRQWTRVRIGNPMSSPGSASDGLRHSLWGARESSMCQNGLMDRDMELALQDIQEDEITSTNRTFFQFEPIDTECSIQFKKSVYTIVDHSADRYMPILCVRIGDFSTSACGRVNETIKSMEYISPWNISCEFESSVDVFNQFIAEWEPIIEQFTGELTIEWTIGSSSRFQNKKMPSGTIITAETSALNINISHSSIYCLRIASESWKRSIHFDPELEEKPTTYLPLTNALPENIEHQSSHLAFTPYKILNLTGVNLRFWVDSPEDAKVLESGETSSFKVSIQTLSSHEKNNTMSIQLFGGWKPLLDIPINKVHRSSYCLAAEETQISKLGRDSRLQLYHLSPKIVWSVSLEKGTKFITVSSASSVWNQTTLALMYSIQTADGGVTNVGPVLPQQTASIPVHAVLGNMKVSCESSEVSNTGVWSKPIDLQKCFDQTSQKSRSFKPKYENQDPTYCHVHQRLLTFKIGDAGTYAVLQASFMPVRSCFVQGESESLQRHRFGPKWTQGHLLLTFIPPFELVNHLPCTLRYQVACRKNTSKKELELEKSSAVYGEVDPMRKKPIHSLCFGMNPYARIQINGTQWTRWFSVSHYTNLPFDSMSLDFSSDTRSSTVTLSESVARTAHVIIENQPICALTRDIVSQSPLSSTDPASNAARRIVVSSDLWARDETGLSLVFGKRQQSNDITNSVITAIQPLPGQNAPIMETVYQNQRWTPLGGWSTPSLPTDRSEWSDENGRTSFCPKDLHLGDGWTWVNEDWMIDQRELDSENRSEEKEGWWYASDFPNAFHAKRNMSDFVRRRLWVRAHVPPKRVMATELPSVSPLAVNRKTRNTKTPNSSPSSKNYIRLAVRKFDNSWSEVLKLDPLNMPSHSLVSTPFRFQSANGKIRSGVVELIAVTEPSSRTVNDIESCNVAKSNQGAAYWFNKNLPLHQMRNGLTNCAQSCLVFYPRVQITNNTTKSVLLRQYCSSDAIMLKARRKSVPVWPEPEGSRQMCLTYADDQKDSGWIFSGPFFIDRVGVLPMRIRHVKDAFLNVIIVVEIERVGDAHFAVTLSEETNQSLATYRLTNISRLPVEYRQRQASTVEAPYSMLRMSSSECFGWDSAILPSEFEIEFRVADVVTAPISFHRLASYPVVELPNGMKLQISVHAEGPTRVICVAEAGSDGEEKVREEDEAVQESLIVTLSVPMIGVSLVDSTPKEVAYFSLQGLEASFSQLPKEQRYSLQAISFRMDNMLPNAYHEAIVWHALEESSTLQPFFALNVTSRLDTPGIWKHFESMSVNFGKRIHVAFDDNLLQELNETIRELSLEPYGETVSSNWEQLLVHFDLLHIDAMEIVFSYNRTKKDREIIISYDKDGVFQRMIKSTGMAIGNIREATLSLNAYVVPNTLMSVEEVKEHLDSFYYRQLLGDISSLLGSSQLFGNPTEFIYHLGEGFQGFVEESIRNRNVAVGLAKGAKSLVGNTLIGFSNSAHGITSSLSKGLTNLASKEHSEESKSTATPSSSRARMQKVMRATSTARVFSGVAGAAIGALNIASKTSEKISKGTASTLGKSTTNVVGRKTSGRFGSASYGCQSRIRQPRAFYGQTKVLCPYNERDSKVQRTIKTIENGKYDKESLEAYVETVHGMSVIITDLHLMLVNEMRQAPEPKWVLSWEEIIDAEFLSGTRTTCGVYLHVINRADRDQFMITCDSPEVAHEMIRKIQFYLHLYGEVEV